MALQIKNGEVLVRAPLRATGAEVEAFVLKHRAWIEARLAKARELAAIEPLTEAQLQALTDRARAVIPARVAHYAPLVGVSYGRVTIRHPRTRWGSCSSKGNLNFNCLLMLAPPEVLDSVVVHELCHRKEMNHSDRFYAEVLRVCPEYRKWNRWLKENGPRLLARIGSRGARGASLRGLDIDGG